MKQKSILFVCTGNEFRSMSAEYCLKKYLSDNGIRGWKVRSAGITAKKQEIYPKTLEVLRELGIKNINHKQRKLTKEMVDNYDIIVAMAEDHLNFIKSKFGCKKVLLFNELVSNKKKRSIQDVKKSEKGYKKKIEMIIKYIYKKIPKLFETASERFYLFSDLVNGLEPHRNGFPFIRLYETKNSVSFMSIDIPYKEDGHILVIPKKRYIDFSEIPKNVLSEMVLSIQKIGKAIDKYHGGYNILLNNGTDAGQYILHSHFHIIPRMYNDGIKIENWNHKNINREKYIKLSNTIKRQIESVK